MASSTPQTVKQESSIPGSSATSEQSTSNTTIKEELSVPLKADDETFEQFYSEVIYLQIEIISFLFLHRLKRLKNVIQS
jgi:hypothetical protein